MHTVILRRDRKSLEYFMKDGGLPFLGIEEEKKRRALTVTITWWAWNVISFISRRE